jgi:DNA repair exonuclease SbcCD ATPase subunit
LFDLIRAANSDYRINACLLSSLQLLHTQIPAKNKITNLENEVEEWKEKFEMSRKELRNLEASKDKRIKTLEEGYKRDMKNLREENKKLKDLVDEYKFKYNLEGNSIKTTQNHARVSKNYIYNGQDNFSLPPSREPSRSNQMIYIKYSLEQILDIKPSNDSVENLIDRVKSFVDKLIKKSNNRNELMNENKILLEKTAALKNESLIQKHALEIKEKDEKYSELLTEFDELKKQVEISNEERLKIKDYEELKELNKTLEDKNKALVEENKNLINKHEETNTALKDKISKLEGQLNNAESITQQKLTDALNESKHKNTRLQEYEDENKKLKEQLEAKNSPRAISSSTGETCYNPLEITNTKLNEMIKREKKFKEEMNELKRKYKALKRIKSDEEKEFAAENRSLQDRLQRLTGSQTENDITSTSDVLENKELKKEISELRNSSSELEKVKKELSNKCDRLASESARKGSMITKLQLDIESYKSLIEEYEAQLAQPK